MKPKLLTALGTYNAGLLRGDVIAGVTVALVALPLSIAIAIASGAPPVAGLVTAVVGGLLISMLGGSRVQIGGPTGAFIVVVYGVIATHGYDGLVLATLMAGPILLGAGCCAPGISSPMCPSRWSTALPSASRSSLRRLRSRISSASRPTRSPPTSSTRSQSCGPPGTAPPGPR